jgi:hypothetical protein
LGLGWPAALPAAERFLVCEEPYSLEEETAQARELRHRRVDIRRRGPIVMVHRGLASFGPENSLQACSAAMDLGADGCEIDVRRSQDGRLYLFHDDSLDRVTQGFGPPSQLTSGDWARLPSRTAFGRPLFAPPPSFPALLSLARQRAMLLHLDLKEPGLEAEVAQWFDAADAWDHVVQINEANAGELRKHPRLQLLPYSVPGLYEGRLDWDQSAVAQALGASGMILVDDPRVATRGLQRPAFEPAPLVKVLRLAVRLTEGDLAPAGPGLQAMACVRDLSRRIDASSNKELRSLLEQSPPVTELPANPAETRAAATRIVERAWAAQQLGLNGDKASTVRAALVKAMRTPSLHPEWAYAGLDAAMAIRALAALDDRSAVPLVIECLAGCAEPSSGPASTRLHRYRLSQHAWAALAELRCRAARKFLRSYIDLDEAAAARYGPLQYEEAARALLQQTLTWNEIAALLRHPNSAVRGTALAVCVDQPNDPRRQALRTAAPWALDLPAATRLPLRTTAPSRPFQPGKR